MAGARRDRGRLERPPRVTRGIEPAQMILTMLLPHLREPLLHLPADESCRGGEAVRLSIVGRRHMVGEPGVGGELVTPQAALVTQQPAILTHIQHPVPAIPIRVTDLRHALTLPGATVYPVGMCASYGLDPRMPGWAEFRRGLITLSTLESMTDWAGRNAGATIRPTPAGRATRPCST